MQLGGIGTVRYRIERNESMLISCNLLKSYLSSDTLIDWLGIWELFTISSAEVERVEEKGKNTSGVIVAKVTNVAKNTPDVRLNLLTVDIGNREIQIITSATNAYIGMITACCPENGMVNGKRITKLEILGIMSEGVCVSEKDLGISQEHTLMIDLPKEYMVGRDIKEYINLDDIIVEIDNKSLTNRPDLWGHYGIAREIAAITGAKLNKLVDPIIKDTEDSVKTLTATVHSDAVNRYAAIKVSGLNQKLVDLNMKLMMHYCGYECSTLSDLVSTYTTLEYGLPVVVVNDDGIENISIKMHQDNEQNCIELNSDNLVVYANGNPIEVAGVCVLESSVATADCSSILIEVANYDATTIRKSSISLHNRNDMSIRHEKSLDPEMVLTSLYRCLQILQTLCPSACVSSNLVDVYKNKQKQRVITLSKKKLSSYLGFNMDDSMVVSILNSLDMDVIVEQDAYVVTIPTYRATKDIEQDADVIEEISRIYGYDNFEPQPLELQLDTMRHATSEYSIEYKVKEVLASKYNLHEVHSYIWYDDDFLKSIGADKSDCMAIVNKTSNRYIRDELGMSVLASTIYNARKYSRYGVFEIGTIYNSNIPKKQLCILLCDSAKMVGETYQHVKNIVYGLIRNLTNESVTFLKADAINSYMDNANVLNIYINELCIGQIGIVIPSITNRYAKTAAVVMAVIDFEKYLEIDVTSYDYQKPPKYPVVTLDYTISLKKNENYQMLENWLSNYSSPLLKSYNLIDSYDNGQKRKLTIRFKISHSDRTLRSEEIRGFAEELLSYLGRQFEVET